MARPGNEGWPGSPGNEAVATSLSITGTTGNSLVVDATTLVVDAGGNHVIIGATAIRSALAPTLHLEGTQPGWTLWETDAPVNEKFWAFSVSGGDFIAQIVNDALDTGVNWIIANRTGNAIASVSFPTTSLGINTTAFGTSAARILALGNASVVMPTAGLANLVHLAGVDFAAGDARLEIQSELGTVIRIGNNAIRLGVAGTGTGSVVMSGVTSGVVTVTVAAAAGTWTMQLPAAVGAAGQQLTDAGGDGITSWAAAGSLREYKNIHGPADPQDALDRLLNTQAYHFNFKEGFGTRDYQTEYVGVLADEAPWAMHYGGSIVNPINTLGYMVLGFQATNRRILQLERALAAAGIPLPEMEKWNG